MNRLCVLSVLIAVASIGNPVSTQEHGENEAQGEVNPSVKLDSWIKSYCLSQLQFRDKGINKIRVRRQYQDHLQQQLNLFQTHLHERQAQDEGKGTEGTNSAGKQFAAFIGLLKLTSYADHACKKYFLDSWSGTNADEDEKRNRRQHLLGGDPILS